MVHIQHRQFQQVSRRDDYVTIRKIFLSFFLILSSYLSHNDCLVVILKFNTVPMWLQLWTTQSIFKQTHANFFNAKIWRYFLITSQLR